jgi:hypothetical protein
VCRPQLRKTTANRVADTNCTPDGSSMSAKTAAEPKSLVLGDPDNLKGRRGARKNVCPRTAAETAAAPRSGWSNVLRAELSRGEFTLQALLPEPVMTFIVDPVTLLHNRAARCQKARKTRFGP